MRIQKKHTNEFKAKVALAAMRDDRGLSELAAQYGVHPIQIGRWKKTAENELPSLFERGSSPKEREVKELIERLYGKIGEVEVENDWLKKKLGL